MATDMQQTPFIKQLAANGMLALGAFRLHAFSSKYRFFLAIE
jgi:hypothetical protein